jgi:hypothetical protein
VPNSSWNWKYDVANKWFRATMVETVLDLEGKVVKRSDD